MVGAAANEFLLGYTPDGNFEIVARPGKFFFQKKNFFFKFLVLYEMLIEFMYRVYFFFCKSHLLFYFYF